MFFFTKKTSNPFNRQLRAASDRFAILSKDLVGASGFELYLPAAGTGLAVSKQMLRLLGLMDSCGS